MKLKINNILASNWFWTVRKWLGTLSNILYFLLLIVLTIYSFLCTTQFQIPLVEWAREENFRSWLIYNFLFHPQPILFVIVICRYLFSCRFNWKEYGASAVICMCVAHACKVSGNEGTFTYFLLLIGMRGLTFRTFIQWYFVIEEILLGITLIACQMGYVENLVYDIEGRNIRMSFGFMYPTVFAAHLLFLFLCLWYLLGEKWNIILAIASFFLAIFVYKGCEARFTTACFILLCIVLIFRGLIIWMKKRKKQKYIMHMGFASLLACIPLVSALGIHVLSLFFDAKINWMVLFNRLVSNRLTLAQKGIEVYGFHLWGKDIPMIGNGGDSELPSRYFYLDSSYIQLSLKCGLLVFGIVLILLLIAGYRAKMAKEWVLLWVLAIAGIHGVFEEHLISLSLCPFLFSAFAQLGRKKIGTKEVNNGEG